MRTGRSQRVSNAKADGSDGESFAAELSAGLHEFRGALTELLSSAGADAHKPLALSRALGVDKNLAWKVSKVIQSSQPRDAFKHLPGSAGMEIFFDAVLRCGGRAQTIVRARSAMQGIGEVVSRHVDDRHTLELFLDNHHDESEDRLYTSRKLAFRGNSGMWGVQAKARLNTAILAPSKTSKDMVDVATIGGWIGFRRLRADARWALFRRHVTLSAESSSVRRQPLDPNEPLDGPMLIREFCSATLPPISVVKESNDILVHELAPSPVGNSGAFTCFFGSVLRQIGPRYADEADDRGDFGAVISAPTETLQFDLLVHRDCAFALQTRADVYGNLSPDASSRTPRERMPLDVKPVELGRFPPVVESVLFPRYGEVIDTSLARCGWNRADFIGLRFTLEYPPFPSTVVISFPLEPRATSSLSKKKSPAHRK